MSWPTPDLVSGLGPLIGAHGVHRSGTQFLAPTRSCGQSLAFRRTRNFDPKGPNSFMATYYIGDVHGCFDSLMRLLAHIDYAPQRDHLYFLGDLINRGPKSKDVLHFVMANPQRVHAVLGNHDWHFLARAAGVSPPKAKDTLDELLADPDCHRMIDFVRHLPLVLRHKGTLLVHAGVCPRWSITDAERWAHKAQALLRSKQWPEALEAARSPFVDDDRIHVAKACGDDDVVKYSHAPPMPHDARIALQVLTRMRNTDASGMPDVAFNKARWAQTQDAHPWFAHPDRKSQSTPIVFGHWASLGLVAKHNVIGLDTGCVWGGALSAYRAEDHTIMSVPAAETTPLRPTASA